MIASDRVHLCCISQSQSSTALNTRTPERCAVKHRSGRVHGMKSRASWAIAPPSPPLSTISEVAPCPHCPTVQRNALGYHTLYTVPIPITSNHHHQNITMAPHPHCANSTSTMRQELARVPVQLYQSSPPIVTSTKTRTFAHLYFAPAPSLYKALCEPQLAQLLQIMQAACTHERKQE